MKGIKKNQEAVGIIPARYDSTRFPGKPLALISNKSLIQRTYENALRCQALKEVVVATDDQRIYDHVKSFRGNVVMTAKDCPSGSDRIQDLLNREPRYNDYELIVNVQGDEPCIDPDTISKTIRALVNDEKAVIGTAITTLTSEADAMNPSVVKCVKDLHDNALYFSRSLIPANKDLTFDPKQVYYRHIGLYVYRRSFLKLYAAMPKTPLQKSEDLEQLKILENGYRIKVALVESVPIDVNHPEDIQKVETYLCTQNSSS